MEVTCSFLFSCEEEEAIGVKSRKVTDLLQPLSFLLTYANIAFPLFIWDNRKVVVELINFPKLIIAAIQGTNSRIIWSQSMQIHLGTDMRT